MDFLPINIPRTNDTKISMRMPFDLIELAFVPEPFPVKSPDFMI